MERKLLYKVRKEVRFEAAHVLENLPPDHQCSRLHGHSYRVVVEMVGEQVDPVTGMLLDFNVVKLVKNMFDHQFLNEVFAKRNHPVPTTAENIARVFYEELNGIILFQGAQDDVTVTSVGIWETETSYAEIWSEEVQT